MKRRKAGTKPGPGKQTKERSLIVLGLILLILGLLLDIYVLWIIGLVLAVVGAVLWLLGSMGRAVGGRSHYY